MSVTEKKKLEPEDLENAAMWRYGEGLTWEHVGTRLKCDPRTLRRWRSKPEWEEAKEKVISILREDALPTAWGCLVDQARQGDVAAAKELLARTDGPVSQKHDVQVAGEVDHNVNTDIARAIIGDDGARGLACGLFERLAAALTVAGGPSDGADEEQVDASEALAASEQGPD